MIAIQRVYDATPAKWKKFIVEKLWPRGIKKQDLDYEAWEPILKAARKGTVTLLYSSRDIEHNNAVALKRYLEAKLKRTK